MIRAVGFLARRKKRQEFDRLYAHSARIKSSDPVAERFARGNVYSTSDIEMLEQEKLSSWKHRRR